MSVLSVIPFDNSREQIWDTVVRNSKNGNFLHLRKFIGYHSDRFDEQSLIVREKDRPVAVFPSNRDEDVIVSHGGLTYAGLIYGRELRTVDVLEIFDVLVEYYRGIGCVRLLYKAIPHIFHRYPAEEDLYALYRRGARLVRRDLSSAVLLPNPIKLSDSRRNTIRKASRFGVIVRRESSIGEFYDLLSSVLQSRHGKMPVHSLADLELLCGRFPEQIKVFGARDESTGGLLAAALIFDFGKEAHAQYLANSDLGRTVGALDLLLEHLLDSVFLGYRYFSFGISTEAAGRSLNEGLIFQKEGFGARGIVHDQYELDLC